VKVPIAAFAAGLLFAAGLGLAGMTQPERVIGFLDFTGQWDPSLALVMVGAIGTFAPLRRLIRGRGRPLWVHAFPAPPDSKVDRRLLGGSALFGLGWGLSGYCPGPAIAAVATLDPAALTFGWAMVVGMATHSAVERLLFRLAPGKSPALEPNPSADRQ
jgi:uncharacterized protein